MQQQKSSKHKHRHNQEAPLHIRHEMKPARTTNQAIACGRTTQRASCMHKHELVSQCRAAEKNRERPQTANRAQHALQKVILQQRKKFKHWDKKRKRRWRVCFALGRAWGNLA
jgi:hypothetical protein